MYRRFNIQQFYVLPTQCIYMLCVDLRTNSDYTSTRHCRIIPCNFILVCFLSSRNCICNIIQPIYPAVWPQTLSSCNPFALYCRSVHFEPIQFIYLSDVFFFRSFPQFLQQVPIQYTMLAYKPFFSHRLQFLYLT